MDNTHTEQRMVFGRIYTQGLFFDLLSLSPMERLKDYLPADLREHVQVFLIVDAYGTAKPLYVSTWSGYTIVPYTPKLMDVTFELEMEDQSLHTKLDEMEKEFPNNFNKLTA